MIQTVRIQGFKALWDVTLDLGQVNVLIGANGSGKSSILEAIGVLGAATDGVVDDAALSRRGVRLGLPALFKTSLQEHRYRRLITLEAGGGEPRAVYRVGLGNPLEKPLPAWQYHSESLLVGDEQLMGRSPRSMRLRLGDEVQVPSDDRGYVQHLLLGETLPDSAVRLLDALRRYRIFAPLTPVLRGVVPDPHPVPTLGLAGGGLAEAVESLLESEHGERLLEALRAAVEWVAGVEVLPPSKSRVPLALPTTRRMLVFVDRWMRDGRNRLSAYDASEGVLYVLFLLVLALHPDLPTFFAVDNVGYGLHPRLARAMTRQFCRLLLEFSPGRQVLLTTHNPLLLDGLPLLDDRVRLFVVERNAELEAVVRRVKVTPELLTRKEETGVALSELWVEGWLGGVPNLW